MKAYLCLGYFHINHELPKPKFIINLGHDLEKILQEILDNYYFEFDRPQFDIDNEFLNTNSDLKELLYILSEFGKLARYYNFDLITDNANIGVNTKKLWEDFENKILDPNDYEKLMDFDLIHEVHQKVSTYIIIVFEKFVAAISRQFIFECLGKQGLRLTASTFFNFGKLYEKDFGIKDYRCQTTKYNQAPRKVHQRTMFDEVHRIMNPNYKAKKILKSEYKGDWPFYADEVIIECRQDHWCVVTIDGFDYALNGAAKGRYKLEFPQDAGMAILGISISDFLQMTLDLGNVKRAK